MRLQVSIQRHTLPAVNIIFATGTGPASRTVRKTATIFNLLEDLNDLVPLESSDTDWGLEDYVVEVAATADQESNYECLHYLPITSVLREDDEVVVRPLLTEDLRAWRKGGRLQITSDGRHLIDGVVFSKKWTPSGRPEFEIPPRKRRRLLEDEVSSEKENLEPLATSSPALMAPGHDEDEDGDEDYVVEEEFAEHGLIANANFDAADELEDDVGDVDGEELQLLLKDAAELEDAQDTDELLENQLKARTTLGKRKRRSSDDQEPTDSQETVFEGFTSPKRSRVLQDVSDRFNDAKSSETDSDVDSVLNDVAEKESSKKQVSQLEGNEEESSDDEDFSAESASSSSDSEEEHTQGKPALKAKSKQKKASHESYVNASNDEASASDGSSSSSDTSSESSNSSSDASSDSESDSKASSDDEDTSDEEALPKKSQSSEPSKYSKGQIETPPTPKSTPSGQGSQRTKANNRRVKRKKMLNALKTKGELPQHATLADLAEYEASQNGTSLGPGDDEAELEAARRKVLSQILFDSETKDGSDAVAQSIEEQKGTDDIGSPTVPETQEVHGREGTPEAARVPDLSDEGKKRILQLEEPDRARQWLRCCFEAAPESSMSQDAIFVAYYRCFNEYGALPGSEFLPCILKEFSRASVEDPFDPYTSIKGIRPRDTFVEPDDTAAVPKSQTSNGEPQTASDPSVPGSMSGSAQAAADSAVAAHEPTDGPGEPSPKRAKLDVSASRRLIFGALGSRNPKTAAQAKAVREKLSAPVRNILPKALTQAQETPSLTRAQDEPQVSWKENLIITAVECERDGMSYPAPPFPFVQHWHKSGKGKRKSEQFDRPSSTSSNHSSALGDATPKAVAPDPTKIASQDANVESRTVSFEKDDRDGLPIPSDFTALTDLEVAQCASGAIIAFKQLEVDMKTFMPQVSEYKVARVSHADGENIDMVLATKFRLQPPPTNDEGEIQNKMGDFIIQAADEEDDGARQLSYSDLLDAKLIETASVQVPASTTGHAGAAEDHGTEIQENQTAVPESVPAAGAQLDEASAGSQIENDTPRHAEISGLIRDAGFNSDIQQARLDSDLAGPTDPGLGLEDEHGTQQSVSSLLQSQSGVVITNTSALENRSSSPFFPPEEEPSQGYDGAQDGTNPSSRPPPASSSSPMRLQTTVEYPEIQMSLGSDLPDQTFSRNSSSHQDAQRLSPPGNDTTLVASEHREPIEPIAEESTNFMGSEDQPFEPRSSSENGVSSDEESEVEEAAKSKNSLLSKLGLGLDGTESSFEISEDGSSSDNDGTALRGLTSSQKRKIMTRASRGAKPGAASRKVSPPALKRTAAQSSSRLKKTPDLLEDDHDDDIDLPPSIKISASQSQARGPRLSQIPKGSQVFDLPLSSDPASPGNNDGEFELRSGKQRVTRNGSGSQSRATRRAATVGNRGGDLGIGQRKFLTTKKSRSLV